MSITLSLPIAGVPFPAEKSQPRAAFYVDGFNVYHAIASMGVTYLKWLDWWSLAESIATGRGETLVKVVFCTAPPIFKDTGVQRRHASYTQALNACGVQVISGFFIKEDRSCRKCGHIWSQPQEKEGDVNLAVSLLGDAYADAFDTAYLVTADNDQAPTLRHLKAVFGQASNKPKRLVVVVPPNRTSSRALSALAGF